MDYAALKTEIQTDPLGLGYDVSPTFYVTNEDDMAVAGLLNEVGGSSETIEPDFVSAADAQAAVLGSEWAGLSDVKQRGWLAIVGLGEIPVKNANIRAQITAIWDPGTTRDNLIALQTRDASRAEALFGEGVTVSHTDVAIALRET